MSEFRQSETITPMVHPDPPVDVFGLLGRSPVFAPLPDETRRALASTARIERFHRPALLNAMGEPLTWLRLVLTGCIEITMRHANGEEATLAELGPGSWVTWVACFATSPPDHDFTSGANTRCVAIPTQAVRELFVAHPELYPRVIEAIGTRLRLLMEWTGESVLLPPEQRMAKLIHLLARAQGGSSRGHCTLQTTQERVARLARCSRQSANLLIGALQQRGLVRVAYGRFEIDDLEALAAFAALA